MVGREANTKPVKIGVIGARGIGEVQGGIEYFCSHFYPELCRHGFTVAIFVRRPTNPVRSQAGVETLYLPVPPLRSLETILHSFGSVIVARLLGIRTLHVHAIGPCVALPLAKALGMRVIIRHVGADYTRSKWGRIAKGTLRFGERCAARYGDTIVCLTDHIAREFSEATGRSQNVFVIPNGIEEPPSVLSTGVLDRLGVTAGRYILGVGRFVPEKNFHLLIQAFLGADLPPDVALILAGEVDYASRYGRSLVEACQRSKRIIMPGTIFGSDLWALYKSAAVFALPSSHEGMSFALLEASIAGTSIIASDIPANSAVCREFARLVPVGSVERLREAIELEWRRDRKKEEVERQVSLCKSQHDWSVIARAMAPLFALPPN